MTDWPILAVERYPVEIIDGDRGTEYPKVADFASSGYCLFLNAGNVTADGFALDQCSFISRERDSRLRKGRLARNDIVLTTRGTVGNFAFFDARVPFEHVRINSGMVILRTDTSKLMPRYFYFAVQSPTFRHQIRALTSGSAQPQLPIRDIRKLRLPLPPMIVQEGIVEVVGAIQDKIELNRRMNETLEAMAQAIFRDWFVDFGPTRRKIGGATDPIEVLGGLVADPDRARELATLFPARIGDDGLPEGWKERPIGELAEISGGSTPSTKSGEYWNGGDRLWATPKDLSKLEGTFLFETERRITDAGLTKIGSGLSPRGTVLLSSRAPIGYLAVADAPTAVNQGFIALRPTSEMPTTLALLWCRANMDVIKAHANGSTFQEISKKNFRPLPVIVGGAAITKAFDEIVKPLLSLIRNRSDECRTLAATRDLLLPKLMSGEIRLRDTEREVAA